MAKMYPEEITELQREQNPRRRAEFKVYDALEAAFADDDDWYVIYSGIWTWVEKRKRLRTREEDFIIAHPTLGVLLLEVKGGGVRVVNGQWKSVDRYGVEHNISDPYNQVAVAAVALERFLNDQPHNPFRGYTFTTAVCFPDFALPEQFPGLQDRLRRLTIDAPKVETIGQTIRDLLQSTSDKHDALGETRLLWFKELLAPSWYINAPLYIQINDVEKKIKKLTEDQFKVVQFAWNAKRLLVTGCAGSGKTILAAETARQIVVKKHQRVLFVCYNRKLSEWIRTSAFFVDNGLMMVANYHKLCADFIQGAKLELPQMPGKTNKENEEHLAVVFPNMLIEAARIIGEQFDAIIVDEGQDFYDTWWTSLQLLLRDEGQLHIYYESHQRLWGPPRELPAEITQGEEPIHLDMNVRNTRPIHNLAMQHHPSKGAGYVAILASNLEPEFVPVPDGKTEHQVVSDIVARLVEVDQVPTKDICILTPLSLVDGNSMWKPDQMLLGKYDIVHHLGIQPHEIFCSSIGAAKGLEFPIVILTELYSPAVSQEIEILGSHLYVGISRARSHLIIVSSKEQFEALDLALTAS